MDAKILFNEYILKNAQNGCVSLSTFQTGCKELPLQKRKNPYSSPQEAGTRGYIRQEKVKQNGVGRL